MSEAWAFDDWLNELETVSSYTGWDADALFDELGEEPTIPPSEYWRKQWKGKDTP